MKQSPSKILKSDFRNWDRIGNASVSEIFLKGKEPSGDLTLVLEIVLDPNETFTFPGRNNETLLILPLFGTLVLEDESIVAGENVVYKTCKRKDTTLQNTSDEEKLDFLLFCFEEENTEDSFFKNSVSFDNRNCLSEINPHLKSKNFIGLYNGREEECYTLQNSENAVFGMVVNGAFEFQNRLLENRDAILLWGIEALEFEALGEDALVLFLETSICS
ncbi:MAG: hypothetical protein KBA33_09510 [Cloacibacterium sp.]|jgi:hypothetical protein|nr:hypothetical protein [Cloacibacterium sp.]